MSDEQTDMDKRFEEGLRILARIIAREHLRSLKAQEEAAQIAVNQHPAGVGEMKVDEQRGAAAGKNGPEWDANREKAINA